MNYELVTLAEKILVGVSATTGNSDLNMGDIIGELWEKLFQSGISATIKNKANPYAIGLYSDYNADSYCVTVGNEVTKAENPELTTKRIRSGTYAKFSVHGHIKNAVAEAWNEIWSMDLNRSFTGDFEEYFSNEVENCDIAIYIALT